MKRRIVQPLPIPLTEITASKTKCFNDNGTYQEQWCCDHLNNHACGDAVCGLFRLRVINGDRLPECKIAERTAIKNNRNILPTKEDIIKLATKYFRFLK